MRICKAAALLVLILAISLLAACSESPMELASGTYVGEYSKLVGEDVKDRTPFSLILNADGTGLHSRDGSEFEVSWSLKGEDVTVRETFLGLSIDYTGTLKDGRLNLFNGDPGKASTAEYVYRKK